MSSEKTSTRVAERGSRGDELTGQCHRLLSGVPAASKAACTLLHDRYRRNPWTSKTPLWFMAPGDE
jgi:hypothetical protein